MTVIFQFSFMTPKHLSCRKLIPGICPTTLKAVLIPAAKPYGTSFRTHAICNI